MIKFLKSIFEIKLYMFRTVPLSIIRIFSLYSQQWYIFSNLFLEQNSTGFGQFLCTPSGVFHSKHSHDIFPHIYFWNKILHVSDSSSVHHQEFFTVHTAMVYFLKFIFGIEFYMFRTIHLSIIRNFSLYTQQWYNFSNLFLE